MSCVFSPSSEFFDSMLTESAFLREDACNSELYAEVHVCCLPFLALCEDAHLEDHAGDFFWMSPGLMISSMMLFLKLFLYEILKTSNLDFLFSTRGPQKVGL